MDNSPLHWWSSIHLSRTMAWTYSFPIWWVWMVILIIIHQWNLCNRFWTPISIHTHLAVAKHWPRNFRNSAEISEVKMNWLILFSTCQQLSQIVWPPSVATVVRPPRQISEYGSYLSSHQVASAHIPGSKTFLLTQHHSLSLCTTGHLTLLLNKDIRLAC